MLEKKLMQYMKYKKKAIQCYKRLDNKNANFFLTKALSRIIPLGILIKSIEDGLRKYEVLHSSVVFLDGEQHIGYIETVTTESVFLTKVLLGKARSYFLYDQIFPHLQCSFEQMEAISQFHNQKYLEEHDLHLITMHKIIIGKVETQSFIEEIINTVTLYSRYRLAPVDYKALKDDISEFYLLNEHRPGHPIAAIQSFGSIHKREVIEDLFKQLYQLIEKKPSSTTYKLLQVWNLIFLKKGFYRDIVVSQHYTVQHCDFFPQNLTTSHGKVRCIDWECVRIAPRTTDLAGLLAFEKVEMSAIRHKALPQLDRLLKLTFMDKILFLFILWVCWVVVHQEEGMEGEHMKMEQTELLNELKRLFAEKGSRNHVNSVISEIYEALI